MATGSDAIIMDALINRLQTLSFTPALSIAYPNVQFPASGQMPDNYLIASFLPNVTEDYSVGEGARLHRGFLQVAVVWKSGAGLVKPLEVSGAIIDHFKKGTLLFHDGVKIKINKQPWIGTPDQSGDRVHVPVTIQYESEN